MDSFKDYITLLESKEPNFCYMLYLNSPYKEQIYALQNSLKIQADELVKPDNFHCTIRHVKLKDNQEPDEFLDWLDKQQLTEIEAFTEEFSMFDDGALVAELDSPQLHEWYNKVNGWLTISGHYADSDFETFKPHISLAYKTKSPLPKFDTFSHRLHVKFTIHKVTDQNKTPIFERSVQGYKGLQYGSMK